MTLRPDGPRPAVAPLLDTLSGPDTLRAVPASRLPGLAAEIREFIGRAVPRQAGHLGPDLGVVELTLALHRVFDAPRDRLVWDTGRQAYVHELLTGRRDFTPRRRRSEPTWYAAPHGAVENARTATALSYADGFAKAHQLLGLHDRHVVAVVDWDALACGMAWEALNNLAASRDLPLVIVVHEAVPTPAPAADGLTDRRLLLRPAPDRVAPDRLAEPSVDALPGSAAGAGGGITLVQAPPERAQAVERPRPTPRSLFDDLGFGYFGPLDGQDAVALEVALRRAKALGGPAVVHCVTRGAPDTGPTAPPPGTVRGPRPAEPSGPSWTSVFSEEMVRLGGEREDIVGVTAAMSRPVGLEAFAKAYPKRVFDVGIAEQHAVTSAAGLALGGVHPVVAVYATFLNRAFDQVLMDVALHGCGVTFALDRAGATGNDGPSHNGMWDMSILQVVPGLRVAAPRDGARLRALLREAVEVEDAPTVVRYPKGVVGADIEPVASVGGLDVLVRARGVSRVLLVSVGAMAQVSLEAAALLAERGVGVTVVDPRWVKPVNSALVGLAAEHELVATVEDNGRVGGVGSAITQALRDAGVTTPLRDFGLLQRFCEHGSRDEVLAEAGLTAHCIAETVEDVLTPDDQPFLRGAS
ncbi:1-deoxy-D-xylulose-5-phosphate synthase N-terminal domain-containing protein [Streptomyces buecherae]|uniref:1-deoxy-D-xylulose-5-phosphate synthase N-terminal domain-containing protein n=1 Tax=Streptomyces buecherae TaxID=2763006 RepID=UPI0020B7D39F|nr:1-deoxy-D-xylulose-5-phosphate synthase [Streptomyces buecherae]